MLRSRLSRMVVALAIVGLGLWVAINLATAQVPGPGQPLPQPPGGGNSVHYHYYGAGYQPGYAAPAYAAPGYVGSGFTNPSLARGLAAQSWTAAQGQAMENHNFAISSYYRNKEVHDAYEAEQRKRFPPLTQEQANRIAQEMGPGRLSAGQFDRSSNVIHRPPLLRDKKFSDLRYQLDQLFHHRTPDNSGLDSDSYVKIKKACDAMQAILDGMVDQLPADTSIAAGHFIRSLAYEGRSAAK
jgi:hypothetical protein